MANGAYYYDEDGVEQFQPAEVVVMACNGVGTRMPCLEAARDLVGDAPVTRKGKSSAPQGDDIPTFVYGEAGTYRDGILARVGAGARECVYGSSSFFFV